MQEQNLGGYVMEIKERIVMLRESMRKNNIDVYVIPSADNHQSEYVGDYFKSREFITGFTGSAGTAVITLDEAGLWTDGRYFIQAENELAGSDVKLYKMGQPHVPTIVQYLDDVLPKNGVLGFDGRVVSMKQGVQFENNLSHKKIKISYQHDLVDKLWFDRPSMSKEPIFLLNKAYTGTSIFEKLNRLRDEMRSAGATAHILTTLDDIAWLFNFRGKDVAYTPVVLCYAVIMLDCVHLFMDKDKMIDDAKDIFYKAGIILHPYNDIYQFVMNLSADEVVLFDPSRINYALYKNIPSDVKQIEQINPCVLMKAKKNDIEVENIKKAHIKDAVAQIKFMYWLKNTIGKETITELSASDKLETFRTMQENYLWPSFEPISAFGAHAAMCHYSSSPETDVEITEGSLLLMDTGGNYLEGSTDVTRTFAIGNISDNLKRDFTNVLRGNLALSRTHFLYGCSGKNLDILARQFLWNENKDYNHGTGHGVGYLLSIHESSGRIVWRGEGEANWALEHGMVITNEPGLYIEDSHGIRLENELLVRNDIKNDFGQFMRFEVITYVPFDLDAIDVSLLNGDEKQQLNEYHKKVFELTSPYLTNDEIEWLKKYTRAI